MRLSSIAFFFASSVFLNGFGEAAPTELVLDSRRAGQPEGVEVPPLDKDIDWKGLKKSGKEYGYIVATSGSAWKSPYYDKQYSGCIKAGLYCGAYHFPAPSQGSGRNQAKYFISSGGGWSKHDNYKLPGGLAIDPAAANEQQPCYGLKPNEVVRWLRDFSDEYYHQTGRYPVIGTDYKWWKQCTNNDSSFKSTHALYLVESEKLPGGWDHWSFYEYAIPDETHLGLGRWYDSSWSLKKFAEGS
ncbi:hypothetical protein FRC03_011721 [Tulasnella sp. 419]|nr:hypothetical protein FRC03_011721 [Tulasnella sp. 419]